MSFKPIEEVRLPLEASGIAGEVCLPVDNLGSRLWRERQSLGR